MSLFGGPECAGVADPLRQIRQQVQADRSVQQDHHRSFQHDEFRPGVLDVHQEEMMRAFQHSPAPTWNLAPLESIQPELTPWSSEYAQSPAMQWDVIAPKITRPALSPREFQRFEMKQRFEARPSPFSMRRPLTVVPRAAMRNVIVDKGKSRESELSEWERQFDARVKEAEDEWTTEAADFDNFDYHHEFRRDSEAYTFERSNPFQPTSNPFAEGIRIVREGGSLSLAALAFEAAVQLNPQHVEAWAALGSAQAQNEKEVPAIRALERCIELDPSNLPALMGLAISYTNEGYDSSAFGTLERWLSVKYPQIVPRLTQESDLGPPDRQDLHKKVTDRLLEAARLSPSGLSMDPDVQVGLGVLFYGAEEYGKAVDCFEAALASNASGSTTHADQAHLLWNRLGATLANSGRSKEAIAAYEQALVLRPNFARARSNMGVAWMNLGDNRKAAQQLLQALAMHRVVEREGVDRNRWDEETIASQQSTNLLETLRRVFNSMGRADLAERVVKGVDVEVFRDFQ